MGGVADIAEPVRPQVLFLPDDRGGVTVEIDGYPQSHVDLDDPGLLVYDYVQHLALAIDGLPPGPLAVTHVGGGGLTLPRYVHHTRPGSPQIVLEPDPSLTELVRRELPLPRGHRIRVRPVDGASGVVQLADASADVLVLDAYAVGRVPAELVGSAFLAQARRVVRPGGLILLNLADEPGLQYVARVAATLAGEVAEIALVATVEMFKGRRYSNVVVIGSDAPLTRLDLPRRVARCALPASVRMPAEVARLSRTARPFGPEGLSTPPPPAPGSWRRT